MRGKYITATNLVCVLFLSSCGQGDAVESFASFLKHLLVSHGKAVPVTVANVLLQERSATMRLPAKLTSSDHAIVKAPQDTKVERVIVNVGDAVDVGTPLAKLSDNESTIKLAQKRLDLKEDQNNLEKDNYFLKNRDNFLQQGRIDQNEYDHLPSDVSTLESSIELLKTEIKDLETTLAKTTIVSPISGTVDDMKVIAGNVVASGTPLFTIINNDPMFVEFELASYETAAIKPGQSVTLHLRDLPGETLTATIDSVAPTINPETKTFLVRATIPNPSKILKVGMPAEVEFLSSQKQRFFVIPKDALISERKWTYVFTVSKGIAHRVQVTPRETKGAFTEIVEGLKDDDLVVVKGHENLEEGTVVDIWGR